MYRGLAGVRYLSKLVDQEARLQLALAGSIFARSSEHSCLAAAISASMVAICWSVRPSPDQLARLQLARLQLARDQLARSRSVQVCGVALQLALDQLALDQLALDQLARSGSIASDQLARLQLARL